MMIMTDDLIKQLMNAGLSKQQATSVTAQTLTNLNINDDGKMLIAEAKRQVEEMKQMISDLKSEYADLQNKILAISDVVTAVKDAQSMYGSVTDEKAKNIIALYAALLSMNEKTGASPEDAVKNAGYIVYAYLGGQAKREISYSD